MIQTRSWSGLFRLRVGGVLPARFCQFQCTVLDVFIAAASGAATMIFLTAQKALKSGVDCEVVSDCDSRLLGSDRLQRSLANFPPAEKRSATGTRGLRQSGDEVEIGSERGREE